MWLKIFSVVILVLIVFCIYVATRPAEFKYERSTLLNSTPDKIFPYLADFKKGSEWNPYERVDPNMKKTYSGPATGVGSQMFFDGNSQSGSGHLEILEAKDPDFVKLKLTMTKPIKAENFIYYRLQPEGNQTRFTWSMEGENGFFGKLMGVIIDCEKMMSDQFEQGFKNLKSVVEK